MPNGRNAGRLYADCTGADGYGQSHSVAGYPEEGDEVECVHCHGRFVVRGGVLHPVEEAKADA